MLSVSTDIARVCIEDSIVGVVVDGQCITVAARSESSSKNHAGDKCKNEGGKELHLFRIYRNCFKN